MKALILSLLIFTRASLFADGNESVFYKEPWKYREQSYKLDKNKTIYVMSPYRCGSTITYNVLRFLFESPTHKCKKTHDLEHNVENKIIFICVRNPLNACYSAIRFYGDMSNSSIEYRCNHIIHHFQKCLEILNQSHYAYLLKYENEIEHLPKLLSKIEGYLNFKINRKDRLFIESEFSKEKVLNFIKKSKYRNFNHYNTLDHIHGDHISTEKNDIFRKNRDLILEKIREKLLPNQELFSQFGYDL